MEVGISGLLVWLMRCMHHHFWKWQTKEKKWTSAGVRVLAEQVWGLGNRGKKGK